MSDKFNQYYESKKIYVTGGSQGIGLSAAKLFVRAGADVIILSRSAMKLENALHELELERRHPKQILSSQALDVTDWDSVNTHLPKAFEKWGEPDILVNCAGIAHPGYLDELPIEKFKEMMDLNYYGALHTCKVSVPYFKKHESGHIINVSSMAGFLGLFGYTGYCASKWAVIGFSEALKAELRPFGIQVSVLAPPNTRTPGLEQENLSKPPEVLKTEEKTTVMDPEEVAHALLEGIPRKKFMIVPSLDGRLAYHLSRYAPKIIQEIIKRPSLH